MNLCNYFFRKLACVKSYGAWFALRAITDWVWGQAGAYEPPLFKHHLCYSLSFHWLEGRGSVLFHGRPLFLITLTHSSASFPTCPVLSCMFSDNQLVFSSSRSYARTVNICWKHISYLDWSEVWKNFSHLGDMGVSVSGLPVKGLLLLVLDNVSHGPPFKSWDVITVGSKLR